MLHDSDDAVGEGFRTSRPASGSSSEPPLLRVAIGSIFGDLLVGECLVLGLNGRFRVERNKKRLCQGENLKSSQDVHSTRSIEDCFLR